MTTYSYTSYTRTPYTSSRKSSHTSSTFTYKKTTHASGSWGNYSTMQWPSIPGSDFRGEFERLWKIYDLNDDGTIAGMELSLFLDALTNLLKRYYGAWKPWQEIRQGLQYDLDKNFDGQITRAEANAFLEKRQASGAAPSYDSPDFVQQYKPPVKRYGKTTTWHSTWSTSGSTGVQAADAACRQPAKYADGMRHMPTACAMCRQPVHPSDSMCAMLGGDLLNPGLVAARAT